MLFYILYSFFFFFFQAEDGIRDPLVTGVQTCALPIYSLLPARPVSVLSVVTTSSDVQNEGTPIFQAAGWIEPRPTPILVTALTEGVVEKLTVVEGQTIKEGHVVARLIQDDARLALEAAEGHREL